MTITKKTKIIYGILFIMMAFTGIFYWFSQPASIPYTPKKIAAKQDAKDTKTFKDKNTAPIGKAVNASINDVALISQVISTGNFGKLNSLRSQADELTLEIKIAELKGKLWEIQGKSQDTTPQNLVLPAIVMPQKSPDLVMPILPALPIMPIILPSIPKPPAVKANTIVVVAVSGVNNNLSATIRTKNNNLVNVSQGQRFNGGMIKEISRKAVVVQYGQKNNGKIVTLPFE